MFSIINGQYGKNWESLCAMLFFWVPPKLCLNVSFSFVQRQSSPASPSISVQAGQLTVHCPSQRCTSPPQASMAAVHTKADAPRRAWQLADPFFFAQWCAGCREGARKEEPWTFRFTLLTNSLALSPPLFFSSPHCRAFENVQEEVYTERLSILKACF